jgi:hypothetical protein
MRVPEPTNPFHIARAYGVQPVAPTRPVQAIAGAGDVVAEAGQRMPEGAQRLVAGVVPGSIDFEGSSPAPDSSALPMYPRSADRNAAATQVTAGRVIDVRG